MPKPQNGRAAQRQRTSASEQEAVVAASNPPPGSMNVSSEGVIRSLQKQLQEATSARALAEAYAYDLEQKVFEQAELLKEYEGAQEDNQQAVGAEGATRTRGPAAANAGRNRAQRVGDPAPVKRS